MFPCIARENLMNEIDIVFVDFLKPDHRNFLDWIFLIKKAPAVTAIAKINSCGQYSNGLLNQAARNLIKAS
ncbi:hypothetical protein D3C87_1533110 [compost metagenome]